ncbi:MAG: acyl-CoA synthetase FdrA [Proteobacteria bacterium]|nr:acyl-CoA synthetase FdrA [Pseudomonadota bacterium]
MAVKVVVKANTYFDSVSLMSLSTKANRIEGLTQAVVAMATEMNKGVLRNVGLYLPEVDAAGSGDLLIVVQAPTAERCESAIAEVEALFDRREPKARGTAGEARYATLEGALRQAPASNLAIISVPGDFAAREVRKALDSGLHVMLFSDNVSVADEVALKQYAHEQGLLVMGPDCGTAILGGVGLCFANKVRRGAIGIVGASGTGSQEISVRIHALSGGITQLIGTGGRDLYEDVGGIMMQDGLRALADDPDTAVIVLVSKPPAKSVEQRVLAQIEDCGKPVVVCFLGGSEEAVVAAGGHYARTTSEAAAKAVALAGGNAAAIDAQPDAAVVDAARRRLAPGQQYIRGLLCGGTLCDELAFITRERYPNVYSNIAKKPEQRLADPETSREHSFIDFGDDDYTRGRPHPMIDPSLRLQRLVKEAQDPSVGVVVMDFILGYGSHEDPVGVTLPAIREAQQAAAAAGRHLEIVGYVLGTEEDTPPRSEQVRRLAEAGVTVAVSNTEAGLLARAIVSH